MNNSDLNTIFGDTADSIREKLGTQDGIKPENFAEEIGKISGGDTFKNVYIGLDEPDASKYMYWFPIDTTLDKTDIKLVKQCYPSESFNDFITNDFTITSNTSTQYSTESQYMKTKDYIISLLNGTSIGSAVKLDLYERIKPSFNNGLIFYNLYNGNNIVKSINRTEYAPDYSTKTLRVFTDGTYSNNYFYTIYHISNSTCKFKIYDLDTKTDVYSITFSWTDSNIPLYTAIINNKVYIHKINSSKYTFYEIDITNNTFNTVGTYSSGNLYTENAVIDNRYILLSGLRNFQSNTNIVLLDTETNSFITINNKIDNIINNSISTYTDFIVPNKSSSNDYTLFSYYNNELYACYRLQYGNSFYPTGCFLVKISYNGTNITVTPLHIIASKNDRAFVFYSPTYYNIDSRAFLYYTNEIRIYLLEESGSGELALGGYYLFTFTPKYDTVKLASIDVDTIKTSSVDSSNNIVVPMLNLTSESYRCSRLLLRFYLDDSKNLYSYIALNEGNYPMKANVFCENEVYSVYVSDGETWRDTFGYEDIESGIVDENATM